MGKRGIEHAGQWYDGWRFSGSDVSSGAEENLPMPINIVPLEQGFVVDGDLAFTDAVDLANWLLDWLGLEEVGDPLEILLQQGG